MKKSLFYIFMALVCAACMLAGCRKDKSGPSDSTGLGTALDNAGSANCYIVSDAGKYSFSAVKGNGKKPIGNIASVEVLWETFGTDTAPQPGDLIAEVSYDEAKNAVSFATAAEFSKGNALIGAKDARGKILWSWHIWMTDKPEDQVYLNGAGTMMDRNLGATSATPGDVGALGLLYQWGRKDPFMGTSSNSKDTFTPAATSPAEWPAPVKSDENNGTIEYAVANPTLFITQNDKNEDWHFTGDKTMDDTRWKPSVKTIYDPCPPGYMVPVGDDKDGIWAKAFKSTGFIGKYDYSRNGYNFGASGDDRKLTGESICWYPAAGQYDPDGKPVSGDGVYWSCSSESSRGFCMAAVKSLSYTVVPAISAPAAYAASVRCMKEHSGGAPSVDPEISVTQPEAYSEKGGDFSIAYSIKNPKEGAKLEASTEDGWITGLAADGKQISFSLTANDTGKERTGSIDLAYEGAAPAKITVRQKAAATPPPADDGTANCYIISEACEYKFPAVKGNSSDPVGTVASVEVLWETFGTATAPKKGDLIAEVSYDGGSNTVSLRTASTFREGNALIGAKDARGKILWSWHIWMTDQPEDQSYKNCSSKMMDRNLGATSATPGDVGALGLLYQWGRKDPFMGASAIAEGTTTQAASTIGTWPEPVVSDEAKGTIDYAVANPTTFIKRNDNNGDWYYAENNKTDNLRWQSSKTIYDPCPPGYRMPSTYPWYYALNVTLYIYTEVSGFDTANLGYDFGASGQCDKKLTAESSCWYPMTGVFLYDSTLDKYLLSNVGTEGHLWTIEKSPDGGNPNALKIGLRKTEISVGTSFTRASASAVRCLKENK